MQNRHITIFWIVSWKCGSNGGKREWWIERKGWPGCMEACCRIWFVWCLRRRLRWWRMSLWTRWWFVTISWISWVNGLLLLFIWSKWCCLFVISILSDCIKRKQHSERWLLPMRYFGIPDSNLQLFIILRIFQWIGCKRTQSRIVCAVILHLQRYEENITVEYPNFDSNYATSFVGKCFVIPALRKSYLWMGRWNVFARIALQAKRVRLRIPS